jgi:putative ABC transport system substrate-binding protein
MAFQADPKTGVITTEKPAIYQWPETAEEGGLLAYGPRLLLCYRDVVSLVDKVLRGAKPAELPIEHPFKFELVVNLNTASALGLTIPSALLLSADEVIDEDPCDFRK